MVPPLVAVIFVIPLTSEVINTGSVGSVVVNETALPYPVPSLLVAKART